MVALGDAVDANMVPLGRSRHVVVVPARSGGSVPRSADSVRAPRSVASDASSDRWGGAHGSRGSRFTFLPPLAEEQGDDAHGRR